MLAQFEIGAAARIITPPLGTLLYGYPFDRPAASVHDDLRVNAIAARQGEVRVILISADICSIGDALAEKVRKMIAEETGVLWENVIISAIHTHSGPSITNTAGWGVANDTYINEILIPQMLAASKEAVAGMVPAVMGIGNTHSNVGINRRELTLEGEVILGQNPYGMYDPEMTVLAFRSLEGKPIVNLIHYGCHPTSAGGNLEISRDWPGYMVDRMEHETGAMAVFFNGAEGDVGPRLSNGKTTGDLSYTQEVGSQAALDAIRAYRKVKEYRQVSLKAINAEIRLPYKPMMSLEEARRRIEVLGDPATLIEVQVKEYASLCEIVKHYEEQEEVKTHMAFCQTLVAFNSVAVVPFPFEMFVEITLRLKKYSPFENTLCVCNTNGAHAYLPSRDQLCRGGYEVAQFTSKKYSLVDNTDEIIINENKKLLDQLLQQSI